MSRFIRGSVGLAGFARPGALFWRRVRDYLDWERQNLRLVVDWVVALYIIIPFGLLGGRYYYGFWNGEIPEAMQSLPLAVLLLVPLLTALASRPILMLEQADAVFLRQCPGWLAGVTVRGLVMFAAFQAIKTLLVAAILLPFLRELYGIAWGTIVVLGLAIWTLHLAVGMLVHFTIVFRRDRFKSNAAAGGLLAVSALFLWAASSGAAAGLAAAAALGTVAALLMRKRTTLSHHFEESAAADTAVRFRFAALLLARAIDKPRPPKRKALLLRRSGPLLPRFAGSWQIRQIADAALKSALRERGYAGMYLQFLVISLAAAAIGPVWLGWIVVPLMLLLFSMWLRGLWIRFAGHAFPPVAAMDSVLLDSACAPAVGVQMLPLAFALSACLGVKVYAAWWGAVVFGLPGAIAGMILAYMLAAFWHKKEQAA
ncbi:ABC transporter permease [Saccharibacillus qingshengii]|uniref:ABC transporter permease n=1 Tax=Saccharibacillus qingshengii TaxID=1763540 RepID=UPI0015536467|nr:ABC transporter permease [Saccharibacillus qingshengii]